jgi:uncharacterized membrane protein YhaH (DUF805 family)
MKRFLTTSGKADRFEWWVVSVIADILMQVTAIFGFLMLSTGKLADRFGGSFLVLAAVFFLWISLTVTFRRLHDRGRPMWSILFYIVPFVGWIWMLIECGFLPSAYTGPKRTLVRKTVNADQSNRPAPQALP